MKKIRDADSKTYKEATANMIFKEKVRYTIEYYWMVIFLPPIVALMILFSIYGALNAPTVQLNVAVVHGLAHLMAEIDMTNTENHGSQAPPLGIWYEETLDEVLLALLVDEPQRGNYSVIIRSHNLSHPDTVEAFIMFAAVGEIDLIMASENDFHALNQMDHFQNLTLLNLGVPAEFFHNEYGLYLHAFPFFGNRVYGGDNEIIIGVATNAERLDQIQHLIYELINY